VGEETKIRELQLTSVIGDTVDVGSCFGDIALHPGASRHHCGDPSVVVVISVMLFVVVVRVGHHRGRGITRVEVWVKYDVKNWEACVIVRPQTVLVRCGLLCLLGVAQLRQYGVVETRGSGTVMMVR
jgi:hypothetical protein